jgi:hypothetical protein
MLHVYFQLEIRKNSGNCTHLRKKAHKIGYRGPTTRDMKSQIKEEDTKTCSRRRDEKNT